jgi:beta-alanine--pyruvate transaminase
MAKGLTNAAVPMGAVAVQRGVHDAIVDGAAAGIEFFHGYTYSGHPVAAAAGLATLEIYRREGLLTRVRGLAETWESAIHSLADAPHVTDIRNLGLMAGLDLAPRPGAPGARGYEMLVRMLEAGVLVRATGDTIALSPPLIVSEGEIGRIVETLRRVISTLD